MKVPHLCGVWKLSSEVNAMVIANEYSKTMYVEAYFWHETDSILFEE